MTEQSSYVLPVQDPDSLVVKALDSWSKEAGFNPCKRSQSSGKKIGFPI